MYKKERRLSLDNRLSFPIKFDYEIVKFSVPSTVNL